MLQAKRRRRERKEKEITSQPHRAAPDANCVMQEGTAIGREFHFSFSLFLYFFLRAWKRCVSAENTNIGHTHTHNIHLLLRRKESTLQVHMVVFSCAVLSRPLSLQPPFFSRIHHSSTGDEWEEVLSRSTTDTRQQTTTTLPRSFSAGRCRRCID